MIPCHTQGEGSFDLAPQLGIGIHFVLKMPVAQNSLVR